MDGYKNEGAGSRGTAGRKKQKAVTGKKEDLKEK